MQDTALKSILGTFMTAAKTSIQDRKIANHDVIANYSAGASNLSAESMSLGSQLVGDLNSTIDNVIQSIELSLESSGVSFTEAQKEAARKIAPFAMAPQVYLENLSSMKSPVSGKPNQHFGIESMNIEDALMTDDVKAVLSTEAYDGQKLSNSVYFSIAYNLGAARQDEFGETFFPTITIDALQSGIDVSIEYTSLFQEFNRSISGKPDDFKRVPVIKHLYDNSIFATDKNRVVPVYRESDNKELFLDEQKYTDTNTGSAIITAPLKFGKKLSLLGISQTDDMLAKGMMDNTDSLDRTIRLDHLYFSMSKKDDSVTEVFKVNAQLYPFFAFVANPQDHHKSMILNFTTDSVVINISSFKTATGANSAVLNEAIDNQYENYKLVFEIGVRGEANVMESNVELQAFKMNLKEVRNAAGDIVPTTDGAYTALKAVADKAKLVGYTLEAYRTNTNIRTRGTLITNDHYNHVYDVPFHAGITALFPIINQTGADNDAGTLTSQVMLAGIFTSAYAVKKLTEFADSLHMLNQNGALQDAKYEGVGRFVTNPWFHTESFELSSVIDSTQSSYRDEDIRAALRLKIKNEVINMYTASNYGVAFEVLRGNLGGNIGVIIGTDLRLKTLLVKDDSTFSLGDGFEAKVVSTLNPLIAGKIFITFGVFDANRNTTPNPLNFGNCIWSPTLSYEVQKTTNGAVSRELHNMPRFLHMIHLPILSVFNVTDVQSVFSKIPVHVSQK